MKKFLVLAVSATFVLSSCSSDNDEDNSVNLVGVWRPTKTFKISGSNGNMLSSENSSACNKNSTYDFKSNNQLVSHIYETDSSTNTCSDAGSETTPYSYDAANKKIIIDGDSYEVLNHTSNEFQIVVDYGHYNNDNIEDQMVLVLTK